MFAALVPDWELLSQHEDLCRLIGLLWLVHEFGGIIMPSSFFVLNVDPKTFMLSLRDHCRNNNNDGHKIAIYANDDDISINCSNVFLGAPKKAEAVAKLIALLKEQLRHYFATTLEIDGIIRKFIAESKNCVLLDGRNVGLQDEDGRAVGVFELAAAHFVTPIVWSSTPLFQGVWIPIDRLLLQLKTQWIGRQMVNVPDSGGAITNLQAIFQQQA